MVEIDWNNYLLSMIGTLIVVIIGGIIVDRILKIKWRETPRDKRNINKKLREIRKVEGTYQYEKDWLKRGSSDNHFIASFISHLISENDFAVIHDSINIFSRYTWFSPIKEFWNVRDNILELNDRINAIYEKKTIFTLYEKTISSENNDDIINNFIERVNMCLKLYFDIILIEDRV